MEKSVGAFLGAFIILFYVFMTGLVLAGIGISIYGLILAFGASIGLGIALKIILR